MRDGSGTASSLAIQDSLSRMTFLPEIDQKMTFTVEDFHVQNCTAVNINNNNLFFILGAAIAWLSLCLLKNRKLSNPRSKAFSPDSLRDVLSSSSSALTQKAECLLWSRDVLRDLRVQSPGELSAQPWAWHLALGSLQPQVEC